MCVLMCLRVACLCLRDVLGMENGLLAHVYLYHLYSLWFSSIIQRLLLLRAVLHFAALFCSLLNESVSFVCIATFGSMYFLLLKAEGLHPNILG